MFNKQFWVCSNQPRRLRIERVADRRVPARSRHLGTSGLELQRILERHSWRRLNGANSERERCASVKRLLPELSNASEPWTPSRSPQPKDSMLALVLVRCCAAIAIAIIVMGAVMFVFGFAGCCGACKESRCLLTIVRTHAIQEELF